MVVFSVSTCPKFAVVIYPELARAEMAGTLTVALVVSLVVLPNVAAETVA